MNSNTMNFVENWINQKYSVSNSSWVAETKASKVALSRHSIGPDGEYFVSPDTNFLKNLAQFIQDQVFSNEGLKKDRYLLQQIVQKKYGWISLKFLSGLRKVKQLTKNWRVIALALALYHNSRELEVSSCGTKVRRITSMVQVWYRCLKSFLKIEQDFLLRTHDHS